MKYSIVEIKKYPLKKRMKANNLSCRQLAKKVNLHYTYISHLVNGRNIASEDVYLRIKKFLDRCSCGEGEACSNCKYK